MIDISVKVLVVKCSSFGCLGLVSSSVWTFFKKFPRIGYQLNHMNLFLELDFLVF